jgi:hypothetical protein
MLNRNTLVLIFCLLFCSNCFAQDMLLNSFSVATTGGASGSIGNESFSSYANGGTAANRMAYQAFVTTTAGSVNRICAQLSSVSDGTHWNAGIYNSDGTTLLRDCTLTEEATTDPGVVCWALDSEYTLIDSTTYTLAVGSSDDTFWQIGRSASGAGGPYYVNSDSGSITDSMPATISTGSSVASYDMVIYADYN